MNDGALLEKNLQKLCEHQPLLVKKLRKRLEELGDISPDPMFRETSSGKWVSGMTGSPFFEKDPKFNFKHIKVPVYALFGIGTPPYLFSLLRALPQEALAVVVVEPSLDLILHTLALTSVFSALPLGCRLCFLVSEERFLMDELMNWTLVPMGIFPVSDMHIEYHPGEIEAVPELKSLGEFFRAEVVYRLTLLGNSPEDTLLGFRHAVLNTPRIISGASLQSFKKVFGGRPFVCVAAGPSLDKNVDLLKGMEDRCVIVACDTVLMPLLKRGIVPHVVTTIERPYITYKTWCQRVLEEYPEKCRGILLVSQSVSYPMIAGRWPGPSMVIGKKGVPVDEWYVGVMLHRDLLYSGLSVAHMALTLALFSDAPAIALIGQDLAYAPSGESHVGGAVGSEIEALEKSKKKVTVSGALGGTVETQALWLTFIQIFERIVSVAQKTVYDCTEGGALIRGTVVIPFADYLDEYVSNEERPSLNMSPLSDQVEGATGLSGLDDRITSARKELAWCVKILDDMEELIKSATAPAIPPARRREKGFRVAELLDKVHSANPVLSFIGQSYTHLAGTVMAETRMMDTVESVDRWKNVHQDIVKSHRANVAFLDQWLVYAYSVVSLDPPKLADKNNIMGFLEKMDRVSDDKSKAEFMVALSDLLCRIDPIMECDFEAEDLWSIARFLSSMGRSEEACILMEKGASLLDNSSVSVEFAGKFLRDWAIMSASHDLCRVPTLGRAMELISNAMRYLPSDADLRRIKEEISARHIDQLRGLSNFYSDMGLMDLSVKIRIAQGRNKAELAMRSDDIISAMDTVKNMISDLHDDLSGEEFSRYMYPFVEWLATTSVRCLDASDERIVANSRRHLDWIVRLITLDGLKGLKFPVATVEGLKEFGLKVRFEIAETDNE